MLEMNTRVAELSGEFDDCQKERQGLERMVDEATQANSKHSLHFGQILMSVENLFLRCTSQRKAIQHFLEIKEEEGAKGGPDEENADDNEESFKRKKQLAIKQLNVILNYLKDFKEITNELRREKRNQQQPTRQHDDMDKVVVHSSQDQRDRSAGKANGKSAEKDNGDAGATAANKDPSKFASSGGKEPSKFSSKS